MITFIAAPLRLSACKTGFPVGTELTDRRQRADFQIFHRRHSIFGCIKFIIFGNAKNVNASIPYNRERSGGVCLKTRKLELGTKNIVGARVTQARMERGMKQVELLAQLQLAGVDMSIPALSLLEGQKRPVSDKELCALADALHVSVDWLLGR